MEQEGNRMRSTLTGGENSVNNSVQPKKQPKKITLLDLERLLILIPGGKTVSVEEASDDEFERFIKQATDIVYSLEERRNMLNSLIGKTLELNGEEVVVKLREWEVNG